MSECPHCQEEVTREAKFCSSCGGKQELQCPSCQHVAKTEHRFCVRCGTSLTDEDTTAPASVSPALDPLPADLPTPLPASSASSGTVQSAPQPTPVSQPGLGTPPLSPSFNGTASQASFGHDGRPITTGQSATGWIIAGYLFSMLGGLIGIIIGLHLWAAKQKTPEGIKIPKYKPAVRRNGLVIFTIALVMFIVFTNMGD